MNSIVTNKLLLEDLIAKLPANIANNLIASQEFDIDKDINNKYFPILELRFSEQVTSEPIIAKLVLKYNINFNILQGSVETISRDKIIGRLVLQLEADKYLLETIISELKQKDVKSKVIGYIARIY